MYRRMHAYLGLIEGLRTPNLFARQKRSRPHTVDQRLVDAHHQSDVCSHTQGAVGAIPRQPLIGDPLSCRGAVVRCPQSVVVVAFLFAHTPSGISFCNAEKSATSCVIAEPF